MHYVVNKNPDVGTGRTKANHGITQDDETSMRCSASRAYNCSEIIAVSVFIRLPPRWCDSLSFAEKDKIKI